MQRSNTHTIGFADYFCSVSEHLGDDRLRCNPCSRSIDDFLEEGMDWTLPSNKFIKDLVTDIYRRSHCKSLSSPIDFRVLYDSLGESAYYLKETQADDLMNIELLEEIAWLSKQLYSDAVDSALFATKPNKAQTSDRVAIRQRANTETKPNNAVGNADEMGKTSKSAKSRAKVLKFPSS